MERREFIQTLAVLPMAAAARAAWDPAGQRARRGEIFGLHQKACGPLFDEQGKWIGRSTSPGGRERLWHAMSLLESEATRDKGNAVIREAFAMRGRKELGSFSHFEFTASTQLLARDKGELTPENHALLTGLVTETFARRGPIRWLGYNDNFPAMDNVVATLGGEMLDDKNSRERGLDGMQKLLEYFVRRGLLAEYTSSTYSPVTLACFADIAEYARDAEARRMALEIEHHVWLDLATHFHAPTDILAGPHSRAYNVDSVGHLHQFHMLFYQVFGDKLWLNPKRFLFPPIEKQEIHHDGDVPFMQCSNVWIAGPTYHPRAEIERIAFSKPFPYRVTGTSEHGTATGVVMNLSASGKFEASSEVMEYAGGELVCTTYMMPDYAVGSATVQFHDGNQTDTFFVNYRRAANAQSIRDTGTIFCRYTVNDDGPGREWTDPRSGERSRDLLADSGRVRAVQKDGTVLALYQAKAQFLDDYKALRLTVVLPEFYRELKRVEVTNDPDMVWVEDEFLFASFRPLILTNRGRKGAVRVERENGYAAIQLVNYEGPPRRFTRKELLETCNGFVAEIGSRAEYGNFDRFKARVLEGRVEDEMAAGQRITRYRRPGVQLDLCHTLYYSQVKYILIDGKPQPRPLFQATGVAAG
jgi:hypothetical protein